MIKDIPFKSRHDTSTRSRPTWHVVVRINAFQIPMTLKSRNAHDNRTIIRNIFLCRSPRSPFFGRVQSIITDHCEFNAPGLSMLTVECVLSSVYPANCLGVFGARVQV